jgi:DNA polymerase
LTLPREEGLKLLGLWPVWQRRAGPERSEAPAGFPADEQAGAEAPSQRVAAPDADMATLDWDALRRAVESCTRCPLHEGRTKAVFGVGDVDADWLIIGEAPGADEDRQGEPFVGQAGRLLDAMLASVGLKRGDNVYIANVLKSRPPGNRDPRPEEVAACIPYLERQIDLIRPRIIIALGRFAAQSLLLTETSISRLRGRVHEYRGVPLVVTYHPAYLLRNSADKAKAWEDLCLAQDTYAANAAQDRRRET